MNEVNAILPTGGDTPPLASGCPDAKREGDQTLETSAAALPGRRCPFWGGHCDTMECPVQWICIARANHKKGTGERSGPGNARAEPANPNED